MESLFAVFGGDFQCYWRSERKRNRQMNMEYDKVEVWARLAYSG